MIITLVYGCGMNSTALVCGAAGLLVLTGCAADPSASEADLTVAAAFYPLQYVAERVGGDGVSVVALAQPGVEPHDLELSPSAVRSLTSTDLVLYLSEFQPAVDDAVDSAGVATLDAATVVELHEGGHTHNEDGASHEEEEDEHGDHDPHFWLDPTLVAQYATAVGEEFAALDPANADTYTANAEALVADLNAIDESFTTGLAQCVRREIVVSHEAFGYLAERYDLHQEGIAGIDPESEPSPARLLEVRTLVEDVGATTIFTESLINPAVAEAIAQDVGATTAVLDPLESVTGDDDYASVMTRNLEALRTALDCA